MLIDFLPQGPFTHFSKITGVVSSFLLHFEPCFKIERTLTVLTLPRSNHFRHARAMCARMFTSPEISMGDLLFV